jgi:hypothetical protein
MKAKVKITLSKVFEIDLIDYGLEENQRFEDLSEDKRFEISDSLLDEIVPEISIETIDY